MLTQLKLSFRILLKNKTYLLLNISGLTLGMVCCLFIFHYVSVEKSYDTFQPLSEKTYRVHLLRFQNEKLSWKSASAFSAVGPALKSEFPEISQECRLAQTNLVMINGERKINFSETKGYYADPSAVNIFGISLLKGNIDDCLIGPEKIIISESQAKKYFGNDNPIGKVITVRDNKYVFTKPSNQLCTVTGIFKDYPLNSHIKFDQIISYETLNQYLQSQGVTDNLAETSWLWNNFYTYIQLKPESTVEQVAAKLPGFCNTHINNLDWYKINKNRAELELMPITAIHLNSNLTNEIEVGGSANGVYFFQIIAILIIVIAWVNYINLSTSRSVERAKEVGIKKLIGAHRSILIKQFMLENALINMVALLISLSLFFIFIQKFNSASGLAENSGIILKTNYRNIFIGLLISGTILSGLYPAFILSAFKPSSVLKGVFKNRESSILLRKSLITFQFAISIILISGTIIISRQLHYMRNKELGATISQTLILKAPSSLKDDNTPNSFISFRTLLLQQSGIKGINSSTGVMGNEITWTQSVKRENDFNESAVTIPNLGVDENFISDYNLKILAGRNFSSKYGTDSKAVLLNEKAVELLNFKNPKDAINKKVIRTGDEDTVTVIGVLANYHHMGLQKEIGPIIFLQKPERAVFYSIKLATDSPDKILAYIQNIWRKYYPEDPFDYYFLDEFFNKQYKADYMFENIFSSFSLIAILISCFGLLGLSAYNVSQRLKEICIRKILGASFKSILVLLSSGFLKLICVSLVIAIPTSYFLMHGWLNNYAYRIEISWWLFILPTIIIFIISFSTIFIHIAKAALTNPAKHLKTN